MVWFNEETILFFYCLTIYSVALPLFQQYLYKTLFIALDYLNKNKCHFDDKD